MNRIVSLLVFVLVCWVCESFTQGITPLSNGVTVAANINKEELDYYSVDSTQTGGLILAVTQTSGIVYVLIGEEYLPTLSNYTFIIANNNVSKNFSVPVYIGTFYIAIYGYAAGSYQITGWGNVPVGQLYDGQVVSGSQNQGQETLYFFDVPANSFDMLVIVQASTGDPDQFIYNQIPGPGVTPVWSNSGIATTSCIYVTLPPAGRYYYTLRAAAGPYTYSTGFFINHGSSCSFSKSITATIN